SNTASSHIYTPSLHDALPIFKNHAANSRVMFDKFQQINAVLWPDNLKALRDQRRLQFFDGLIFIKDAMRSHNGNDVHVFLLENRSEEHTSELQSRFDLVCRLL